MKRRGKSVRREISILERLQNIRAMLIEVRESLGEESGVEYEAPIEAVSELISDVETEAKKGVVENVTNPESKADDEQLAASEEQTDSAPRRRGRPRKVVANVEEGENQTLGITRRRGKTKKDGENKELFPFYEQSLF